MTLTELGPAIEQYLDARLELIDPGTGEPPTSSGAANAVLGIRLCYRLRYDEVTDTGEHWVDFPQLSDPAAGSYARATRQEREALPFIALRRDPPLQLRAEGMLTETRRGNRRSYPGDSSGNARHRCRNGHNILFRHSGNSRSDREVLGAGAGLLMELTGPAPEDRFSFIAEDGSTAALLRAVQPAAELDLAGPLPLSVHGSTARGILATAEGVVSARTPASVVAVDDFGDDLDAAAAEYLAARLRRDAGKLAKRPA